MRKTTAVACHWIRSRNQSELVWIVGNREKFGENGVVPVNTTRKNVIHSEWESDWIMMPQMTPLVALAALLHDWGKANEAFQKKLKNGAKTGDDFRHEWVSCQLIVNMVMSCKNKENDREWLTQLSAWPPPKKSRVKSLDISDQDGLGGLPPIASVICWLILAHHRMPVLPKEKARKYGATSIESFAEMLSELRGCWGYAKESGQKAVKFKAGLLEDSDDWCNQVHKWANKALDEHDAIVQMISGSAFRLALCYMRISLMTADYFVSSQPAQKDWQGNQELYANTEKGTLKQKLDEHLTGVAKQAMKILHRLPKMAERMESARDIRAMKKKSPPRFAWQDKAAGKITDVRKEMDKNDDYRWFIVNMASTGCGKTIANAKIMRAISPGGDELRYFLALGLRALTLQTGDEYRGKLGLTGDDLAVLVGDTAVRDLHALDVREQYLEDSGEIENRESLLDGDLDYLVDPSDDFLDILFQQPGKAKKNKAFLYKPVVVATIDHIAAATETTRGGKYMLPLLRLMTSDLVIDEVDDFGPGDLWTIARLVHLAGMLGRNVVISSATIPPDLAEALFFAYQKGRSIHGSFMGRPEKTVCVWCDEHKTSTAKPDTDDDAKARDQFHEAHKTFVEKRVAEIKKQTVRRKAKIMECRPGEGNLPKEAEPKETYFSQIQEAAIALHDEHSITDRPSGKRVSFGVIRMSNIDPCVAVSQFLLTKDWKTGYDVRLMTYHSRQTRLLRHEQERYIDKVLRRGENWQEDILEKDPDLRRHIDGTTAENLLFIVVATPVEEIGRDHDFDWAVIEPSSYRSIIQMAGRVLRHRQQKEDIKTPNIAVMQWNLRGIQNASTAFCRPGYETGGKYVLTGHDMKKLADESELLAGINSIPRIEKSPGLQPKERLIDLEHQVMQDFNDISEKGPLKLHGYLDEYWWLTGLPQIMRPFREGRPEVELYYCHGEKGEDPLGFYEKTREGNMNPVSKSYNIEPLSPMDKSAEARLWLCRDYEESLLRQAEKEIGASVDSADIGRVAKKYGRISVPVGYIENNKKLSYSSDFGIYRKQNGYWS